jgi:hypothetical protein
MLQAVCAFHISCTHVLYYMLWHCTTAASITAMRAALLLRGAAADAYC